MREQDARAGGTCATSARVTSARSSLGTSSLEVAVALKNSASIICTNCISSILWAASCRVVASCATIRSCTPHTAHGGCSLPLTEGRVVH